MLPQIIQWNTDRVRKENNKFIEKVETINSVIKRTVEKKEKQNEIIENGKLSPQQGMSWLRLTSVKQLLFLMIQHSSKRKIA